MHDAAAPAKETAAPRTPEAEGAPGGDPDPAR